MMLDMYQIYIACCVLVMQIFFIVLGYWCGLDTPKNSTCFKWACHRLVLFVSHLLLEQTRETDECLGDYSPSDYFYIKVILEASQVISCAPLVLSLHSRECLSFKQSRMISKVTFWSMHLTCWACNWASWCNVIWNDQGKHPAGINLEVAGVKMLIPWT